MCLGKGPLPTCGAWAQYLRVQVGNTDGRRAWVTLTHDMASWRGSDVRAHRGTFREKVMVRIRGSHAGRRSWEYDNVQHYKEKIARDIMVLCLIVFDWTHLVEKRRRMVIIVIYITSRVRYAASDCVSEWPLEDKILLEVNLGKKFRPMYLLVIKLLCKKTLLNVTPVDNCDNFRKQMYKWIR